MKAKRNMLLVIVLQFLTWGKSLCTFCVRVRRELPSMLMRMSQPKNYWRQGWSPLLSGSISATLLPLSLLFSARWVPGLFSHFWLILAYSTCSFLSCVFASDCGLSGPSPLHCSLSPVCIYLLVCSAFRRYTK